MLTPDEKELFQAGAEVVLAPYKELTLRAFGPLAEQVGDMLGDYGRLARFKNLARIMGKMQKITEECGIQIQIIPPRVLLPTMQFASIEDDDALQDKWAALLANAAASSDRISPSFPEILHSLTSVEVRFLDSTFENTANTERDFETQFQEEVRESLDSSGTEVRFAIPSNSLRDVNEMMLDNLQRLGIIRVVPASPLRVNSTPMGNPSEEFLITAFGRAFIQTCRPPGKANV